MKFSRKLSFVVAAVAIPLSALTFGTGVAYAADETVVSDVVDSALDNAGTTITDPALLDEIEASLNEAIDSGIVDPEVIANPDAAIDEQLTEQEQLWDQTAPQWKAAFETIRSSFEACRAEGGQSTATCARTLGFQLQVAHAEAELAALDAKIAAISSLPADQQASALANLEAQRAGLVTRLDRAATKIASASAPAAADAAALGRLNSVSGQLKSRAPESSSGSAGSPTAPKTVSPPATVKVEPGSGNSSNQNNGRGNGAENSRGNSANNR